MKPTLRFLALFTFLCLPSLGLATQADETSITIAKQTPGAVPFINQLTLIASDTSVLTSIQFSIESKPGSVTRPLSGSYATSYLLDRGDILPASGQIFLSVYGLYANYANQVTLTYYFADGSSKQTDVTITTAVFTDGCGYDTPLVLQPRSDETNLSYDYIMIKGLCDVFSPAVIDTDGALRWVGPAGIADISSTFYDNAFYIASGISLYRIDLDGTVTLLHIYSDAGVTYIHHNIDHGKVGIVLQVNTDAYYESTNLEVDAAGNVLKTWSLADIIGNAMLAGGDDPTEFVYDSPRDWFHNNAATYNRADDSIIFSSRENFVICLDYETNDIKWILGDPTKAWHQYSSLAKYTLSLPPDSLPPVGQHAVSITHDQNLLLFDNGENSWAHVPAGVQRHYSSPRKYSLNLADQSATEVWNYKMDQSVFSFICSSVYEDASDNYLVDYAFVGASNPANAQILGLDSAGEKVFYYQYGPTNYCGTAFNAIPLHLEHTKFPAVGPKALNISTRGLVSSDDKTLIAGFIVTGLDQKQVALRVLGPSLAGAGVADPVSDPQLTLYDSSGVLITTNDDWSSDQSAGELDALGLAPDDPAEAAAIQTLAPGSYTVVARGKGTDAGTGLLEAYDISASANSRLANISTRGFVGSADNALISGFIVGDVDNATLLIRAIGPSLSDSVDAPLADPVLIIYDSNGTSLSSNDDWQDDPNFLDIEKQGLAPTDKLEAATIIHPGPGAYTVVVSPGQGGDGIGLAEVYDLD